MHSRRIAVPMTSLLIIVMTASILPPAHAATGSVVGVVGARNCAIDPTWQVRVTPAKGGTPTLLPVHDGVFEVPDLPEGPYKFEILDARGNPLAEAVTRLVPAGTTPVRLLVVCPAPGMSKTTKTTLIVLGSVLVGGAIGYALGNDDNETPASPFMP